MTPQPPFRLRAYAKVNLALEVLGPREDGLHEIVSLVQTISLHDVVRCSPAELLQVRTEPPVVAMEENLAGRAAALLARELGRHPGADVLIRKRIPLASGLGGGSSDAAATLRLLVHTWGEPVPRDTLLRVAAEVGSDVPLFVVGGTVLVRGRGERVESVPGLPRVWLALACPPSPIADKTRALYRALRPDDWSDGSRTLRLAREGGAGVLPWDSSLPNAFARAADAVYPGFADLRHRLADAAGAPLHLTGAGPSLFATFPRRADALAAARRMGRLGVSCYVAHSVQSARVRR